MWKTRVVMLLLSSDDMASPASIGQWTGDSRHLRHGLVTRIGAYGDYT